MTHHIISLDSWMTSNSTITLKDFHDIGIRNAYRFVPNAYDVKPPYLKQYRIPSKNMMISVVTDTYMYAKHNNLVTDEDEDGDKDEDKDLDEESDEGSDEDEDEDENLDEDGCEMEPEEESDEDTPNEDYTDEDITDEDYLEEEFLNKLMQEESEEFMKTSFEEPKDLFGEFPMLKNMTPRTPKFL
ncbi:hypothetical protein KR009_002286 [Drosophila setifemur]|nr:hypothetical protein KR009_002286 [Drosophila setifemur]